MNSKPLLYLASPYTHEERLIEETRFYEVCQAAAELMRRGVLVFSPVAHSHPIALHDLPRHSDFWVEIDKRFLSVCDAVIVLMLPGWDASQGIGAEVRFAWEHRKRVVYADPDVANWPDRVADIISGGILNGPGFNVVSRYHGPHLDQAIYGSQQENAPAP